MAYYRYAQGQLPPLMNCLLTTDPVVICQGPEVFQTTELPGASPRPTQHPQRSESLTPYLYIQHSSPGFILHKTNETQALQAFQIHLLTYVSHNRQDEATSNLWG